MLLRFEAIHIHGQLGRRNDIGEEDELPARELRAITQVEIFRQRVMLPAARLRRCRSGARGRPCR